MTVAPYIKIAVISDLHCQKEENSSKVTRLHTQLLDNPITSNPVESLKKMIAEEEKKVDYFLVLGDVTDKADLDGFVLGIKFIKELFITLDAKKLIYAVGNHDMYRKTGDESIDQQIQDSEYMMKRTNGFPFLFKDESVENLEKDFWTDKYCVYEDDKSIFFILNTSCFMGDTKSLNPLIIDETLYEKIKIKLTNYKSNNKVKLAICHHHPIQHSDINDKYKSLDCITRADKLLELLTENNFTLYMHGHKHFPRLKCDDNLPIFCSGSFSSLENTASFNESNTVHFINIYNNEQNNKYKGTIETWIYNCTSGWIKSTDLNVRFPTYTGFGVNLNIEDLTKRIYDHFYKEFEKTGSHDIYIPITYDRVINEFPDLEFLTPLQQKKFEEELYIYQIEFGRGKKTNKRTLQKTFSL